LQIPSSQDGESEGSCRAMGQVKGASGTHEAGGYLQTAPCPSGERGVEIPLALVLPVVQQQAPQIYFY
jgi:hypothetical protein